MTPEELEKLPKPLERTMTALEMDIMLEVVNRIQECSQITPVTDWLLNRMEKLRNKILATLKTGGNFTTEQLMILDQVLCHEMSGYEVREKTMELMVENTENWQLYEIFMVRKKLINLSDGTLGQYKRVIEDFLRWCPKKLKDVTADDIRMYMVYYRKTHDISTRTQDGHRLIFSSFFTLLHDNGYIPSNPSAALDPIKYKAKVREPLSRLEVEKIRRKFQNIQEEAIFEMFYSTGCRVSEVADMKLSDINFEEGSIKVCGKGNKERFVHLTPKAILALKAYLETRNDNTDAVFVVGKRKTAGMGKSTLEKIVKEICSRTDIQRTVTPHVLRHTFATHMLETSPIDVVQTLLGHEKLDTTKIYAKTSMMVIKDNFYRSHL